MNEAKYIQHNPRTSEGSEGLAELFARLAKTNPRVTFVRMFANQVLVDRQFDLLETYIDDGLIQHDPEIADGIVAFRSKLQAAANGTPGIDYKQLHRVLADGNFVLCMSEGYKSGIHSSIYDLFRVADGMIAECWNTISTIAPRSEWKNDNGKF